MAPVNRSVRGLTILDCAASGPILPLASGPAARARLSVCRSPADAQRRRRRHRHPGPGSPPQGRPRSARLAAWSGDRAYPRSLAAVGAAAQRRSLRGLARGRTIRGHARAGEQCDQGQGACRHRVVSRRPGQHRPRHGENAFGLIRLVETAPSPTRSLRLLRRMVDCGRATRVPCLRA